MVDKVFLVKASVCNLCYGEKLKGGGDMRVIIVALFLMGSLSVQAECEVLLGSDIHEKLWNEAIDAENALVALRLTSQTLIQQALIKQEELFVFKDASGRDVGALLNKQSLAELVMAYAPTISDLYHFGVVVNLPIMQLETRKINQLATQVAAGLSVEDVKNLAQQLTMKILAFNEEYISKLYLQIYERVNKSYVGHFAQLKAEGRSRYEDLYTYKHYFIEIANYTSRLLSEARGEKIGVGFLPKDERPDPENKLPIGFIF